jgi:hypothetical protein
MLSLSNFSKEQLFNGHKCILIIVPVLWPYIKRPRWNTDRNDNDTSPIFIHKLHNLMLYFLSEPQLDLEVRYGVNLNFSKDSLLTSMPERVLYQEMYDKGRKERRLMR